MQAALAQRHLFLRRGGFRFALGALVLVLLAAIGFYLLRPSPAQPLPTLSQQALEQRYGLRVNLVAVTAAGGMVDLRLKFVDAQKVRLLLEDKANFPVLRVDGRTLHPSAEDLARKLLFEDGADLFLLYPNAGGAVKPGMQVTLMFGGLILEPIEAR